MKVIAFACDRCKKVVQNEGSIFCLARFTGEEIIEEDISALHFCSDCTSEMVSKVLTFEIKNYEDEKKKVIESKGKKENERKKKVDVGKVLALRRAGWSDEKIAEEMNLPEKVVQDCY